MRCFYCEKLALGILSADQLPAREQNHIFKVLRGKEDSRIMLIDGKGSIAEAMIADRHSLNVLSVCSIPEPETRVHLFVAPPRKNQMDQLLKQSAEVGVWSITPIITERSVVKPEPESSPDRMEVLLQEGCKQAHNPFLPTIKPVKKLAETEAEIRNFVHAFFGSTADCGTSGAHKSISGPAQISGDVAWIVGPEGGFTDAEEDFLTSCGAKALKIGSWVMRVETAAIVGIANLSN